MTGGQANPYYSAYAWWWLDEWGHEHGPCETQQTALRELLEHMQPKRTPWQLLKDVLKPR